MTDSLAKQATGLLKAIDDGLQSEPAQKPRQYIGGSSVGHDCDAYLSMTLRGFPDNNIDSQLKRIFELGHLLEDVLVAHIKRGDFYDELYEVDPASGDQWEYKSHGGHHVSHFDGVAIDRKLGSIVFEAKSMNENKFNSFVKNGVRISHPMYFFQCQDYMDLSKLPYAVIVGYCKNNSKIHAEYLELNPAYAGWLRARIDDVIENGGERIAYDSIEWRCKGCFKRDACWGKATPAKSCVTCKFAKPDLNRDDKSWWCTAYDKQAGELCSAYQVYEPIERE